MLQTHLPQSPVAAALETLWAEMEDIERAAEARMDEIDAAYDGPEHEGHCTNPRCRQGYEGHQVPSQCIWCHAPVEALS